MIEKLFAPRNRLPVIYQAERSECALACVAMVAGFYGLKIDITGLRRQQPVSSAGATVSRIMAIANSVNLTSRALKLEVEELAKLQLPAILHWNMDHFVVLRKVKRRSIVVHDPAVGMREYRIEETGRHFTGVALELNPSRQFRKEDLKRINRLTDFFRTSRSFYASVAQVFLVSLFIQLIALVTPFYVQLTVDQGLARRDPDLILTIALAFLIIALAKVALGYLRGLVLIYFSNQLGFQMVTNIFYHLIRLPVEFFERRHIGDIVSRFGSIDNIKQMVTQEMITVVVDGVFSITTLILLYIYSPFLATLAVVFLAVFVLARVTMLPFEKARRQEVIVADASQQSVFMENIRSILVTKIYGNERQRIQLWQNNYAELINTGVHLSRFQIAATAVQTLIFGIDHVATIYFGSTLVYGQQLSIGQLMGFIFLKQHFIGSITAMIPKVVEIRLLRLQLERLADITFAEPEFEELELSVFRRRVQGGLSARGLGYKYPGYENHAIDKLDLDIRPGEFVVITGPSGSGKSTLLKLLTGVIQPSAGSVLVDGVEMGEFGVRNYRVDIAAVMHSDNLLAGSLTSNIVMDREIADEKKLEEVTRLVAIHDDIAALPMGFNTLVGDMSASLSAGQVQRILLARAVYKQPRILFMDEAMSNLGNDMAANILRELMKKGITIVMITHNPKLANLAAQRIAIPGSNHPESLHGAPCLKSQQA